NIAWNCVHKWAQGERAEDEAAVFLGEDGARASLTWSKLSRAVTKLAEALVAAGVQPGDRVGIYMPMSPAAAVASHACAHVGAVQVPIFSGFAAPAIAARLHDARAKAVLAANRSLRRGNRLDLAGSLDDPLREAPRVQPVRL